MRVTRLMTATILALIYAIGCFAQNTTAQRPSVTVNLKSGEPVHGLLVEINVETIQVQQRHARRFIKLDDIASIIFFVRNSGNIQPALSAQAKIAARDALKALRKLAVATDVGVDEQEYKTRFIEMRSVLDDALSFIPIGLLHQELSLAALEYHTAILWFESNLDKDTPENREKLREQAERRLKLYPSYEVIGEPNAWNVRNAIFQSARLHIDRADALFKQQ